ncbi:Rap30/74 interaction domain-containing protein [Leucogyrophana mollusca]|uniref:Rap30/74 interaction domain-containing protein n=1 Tax=Leucogyrophana mollusca TaxID=85980 RepID=A0ACB8BVP0_9AGAM|nr:Rap30/74 interaction domain-containing protein [Leucogyrophana mollusca]
MPPKPSESLLFHKKKPVRKEPSGTPPNGTPTATSPRKSATPRQQPTPPDADTDDNTKLPDGDFAEYKLMSSALNGWKYDIMKFSSRTPVDISTWEEPIKLNRKELKREEVSAPVQVAAGPMLGPDGKPVIGPDGKVVMVDAEGKPMMNNNGAGEASSSKDKDTKGKGAANGKKRFQKKTRQVFLVPDATRQLRREERYPWVMEDAKQNEVWVGKLEEVAKAETHALFMPAAQEFFKFVPANRWYKFQKKPNYHIPTLEEAESIMAKIQKNKDPQTWLLHNRNGKAPSTATAAMFKAEPDSGASGSSLVHNASQSRGPGGRKLVSVHRSARGDDDEEGGGRKRKEEDEAEGDIDEGVFSEDPADDDEQEAPDINDEEAKELEERLKREYKAANKQREGHVDESDEEDDESQLTKDGKALKKLVRNLEKNIAYDSDDERKNPYASSEEEESEEEIPVATNEPAIQQQPQQVKSRASSQQPSPKPSQSSASQPQNASAAGSRATSPALSPGLGGHSVVAKRATSPKAPKLKSTNGSRATSPLSGQGAGSRATSPVSGSRATSPVTVRSPTSPTASGSASVPKPANKRKATDDLTGSGPPSGSPTSGPAAAPKPKRRKPLPPGPPPGGELEDRMLIEWLQNTPNATTRDCIHHFTPYLTTDAKKSKFTTLVKQVAQLRGGVLVLRSATPEATSQPSTPAAA